VPFGEDLDGAVYLQIAGSDFDSKPKPTWWLIGRVHLTKADERGGFAGDLKSRRSILL
jgi:hypothetical protein